MVAIKFEFPKELEYYVKVYVEGSKVQHDGSIERITFIPVEYSEETKNFMVSTIMGCGNGTLLDWTNEGKQRYG